MSKLKVGCLISVGCLGTVVLLIAAIGIALYYGFVSADSTFSPKIDVLFGKIADGSFSECYETEAGRALRASITKEEFAALGKSLALRLGDLQSKSLQSFKMRQMNAETFCDITYSAIFAKGSGTILATYEKEEGVWKLHTFRVNSKQLEQKPVTRQCPDCGEGCTESDRFCPACGVGLPEAADEPEPSEAIERADLA